MIRIENLTFQYQGGKRNALEGVNLSIEKGDFLGIIGESGAGKTSLTYAINGIIPHHYPGDYYGSVTVDGIDSFDTTPSALSLKIGSVLQDIDSQMVSAVVEDEILYGLENFSVSRDEIESRLTGSLEATGILPLRYRSISSLSGGQKQKVAIAAILALNPDVLLLDEPTSELDPRSSVQIFEILKALNEQQGITIIIVEQKIMLLSEYAKNMAVMCNGKIVLHGGVRKVMENSTQLEKIGIHCPRVVTLSNALTDAGIYDGEVCINLNEAEKMVRGLTHD